MGKVVTDTAQRIYDSHDGLTGQTLVWRVGPDALYYFQMLPEYQAIIDRFLRPYPPDLRGYLLVNGYHEVRVDPALKHTAELMADNVVMAMVDFPAR